MSTSSTTPSPAKLAAKYGGRINSTVVLSSIVAASGGILFGFDLGISGGLNATESFLRKFFPDVFEKMKSDTHISNYCKFNSQLLTTFTSSLYIAGLFSSLLASRVVTETYGRRKSIIAGGALFLMGSTLGGAAVNVHMLFLARILLGFGVGFTNQSIPLYLSEIAHPRYRGAISGGFDICISLGIFVANLINYGAQRIKAGWGWRISLSSAALPASFLLIGAIFLPESPASIIHRGGDPHHARHLLHRIRGTSDVEEELNDIVAAAQEASKVASAEHPFRLHARRMYRPHLVMAVALPLFIPLTGVSAVNLYAPVMFRAIGMRESASLMTIVITRAVSLACTVMAILVAVDRFGRRPLFFTGGLVMLVANAALGAVLKAKLHDHGTLSRGESYLVIVLLCFFLAGFGWSWGPMAWLVTSEIFPIEIRSAGQSLQVSVNFLVNFAMAQSLLAVLCGLKAGLFFFFVGWVFVMTLFVYFLLPETKGVPLEQMGEVWRNHWYWKWFVTTNKVIKENNEGERTDI